MYKGGKELTEQIATLTAQVDRYKAELKQQQANGVNTMTRTENSSIFTDSEVKGLLKPRFRLKKANKPTSQQPEEQPVEAAGVRINIEDGVLSLGDKAFEDRDRSTNPEFGDTSNNVGD